MITSSDVISFLVALLVLRGRRRGCPPPRRTGDAGRPPSPPYA
ncbi:hypothetical protein AB0D99_07375 [Streptomyces sp. NPDC047971]